MFQSIRVVPNLDLRGYVLEINSEFIGPVFSSAREAQVVFRWLTAAATELDLLLFTDWGDGTHPDEEDSDPVH